MYKISSIFESVNMGISACKICPKMIFLGHDPFWGPLFNLIRVDQIQVKLASAQPYLDKALLQSIAAPLDFPLSSYNPLKM